MNPLHALKVLQFVTVLLLIFYQIRFIDTMKSESVLVRHLKLFESRIEDWEKPCKIQMTQPVDKVKNIKIKFFEKSATEKFQIFLSKNGGHCGGWLEHDHLLFLKEVKKNNSPNHKWSTLQKLLPGFEICLNNFCIKTF